MINIATMGKFDGIPTRKASTKYGGASSATWPTQKPHQFPLVKILSIDDDKQYINITITEVKEGNE